MYGEKGEEVRNGGGEKGGGRREKDTQHSTLVGRC